jgi:hypothetical protein
MLNVVPMTADSIGDAQTAAELFASSSPSA